jgi:hypothetical protein
VTDLDADPALLATPVTPGSAADLGDRLILTPAALNPTPSDEDIRRLAFEYAHGDRDGDGVAESVPVNVVVLVPTARASQAWSAYATRICYVGDLQAGVAALKAGHVGLVVLVNKYDGIDLPGKACELLVLDGVPTPMDAWERREATVLAGSPVRLAREVQRIEQGMGRGVRDTKDHCAVLLLGSGLARATWDQRYVSRFSPATRVQLALSRDVAALIRDGGLTAVRAALNACLDRDPEWTRRSGRALAEVRYADAGVIRPEAVALREAFDLAAAGQARAAADRVQRAVNDLEDPATRGWLMEQKAAYLNMTDPAAAQALLASAVRENRYVLRPAAGINPAAARPAAAQAQAAAQFLAATYPDGMSLVLGVKSMLEEIQWDNERTDEAEAAWARLGQHLGFASTRPEKQFGTGPDNLWVLGARHVVTELKTGATTSTIDKHDLDQLGGSVRWDREHAPDVTSLPVMVHPSRECHGLGTPVPGMLVVTPDKLGKLKAAVTALAVALADGPGRWADEQAVATALAHQQLNGGQIFTAYAEPIRIALRT